MLVPIKGSAKKKENEEEEEEEDSVFSLSLLLQAMQPCI